MHASWYTVPYLEEYRAEFKMSSPDGGTFNKAPRTLSFPPNRQAAIIQHQEFFLGSSGAIHPALGPEPDDILVTKHRVSAFAGTDLEMLLRAKEIETIVLFGIATSGVVLSTLLQAGDADYRIVVIADCCADQDEELHEDLLTRLFPKQAEVIAAGDFLKAVQSGSLDTSDLEALTRFVKTQAASPKTQVRYSPPSLVIVCGSFAAISHP